MASDAQRKANAKYLASKKTLTIRIDHDEADEISDAAEKAGQSVQAYFLQAVRDRLDGKSTYGGVVENIERVPLTEEKPRCSISPALKRAIRKSIQDAIQNFSEDEYDKLRYEFEKLVFETFVEEARKSKKPLPDKKNNEEPPKEDADVNECICQSLL